MIRRPPRSTQSRSSAASDVYKRQFEDVHATAEHVGGLLGVSPGDVVVCSTGLIGERPPRQRLLDGITAAAGVLAADGGPAAAEAIMTTDTVPKTVHVVRDGWSIGGMAKGAGMLAPDAITTTVSEVDMQPSESIRSKVSAVAARSAASASSASTTASVVSTQSIVASAGASMPAPLAIPPIDQPSRTTCTVLGTVSVVMIASAAAGPPSAARAPATAVMPSSSRCG